MQGSIIHGDGDTERVIMKRVKNRKAVRSCLSIEELASQRSLLCCQKGSVPHALIYVSAP